MCCLFEIIKKKEEEEEERKMVDGETEGRKEKE